MPTAVVPFRSGKSRLALATQERKEVALRMLAGVLDACTAVAPAVVVTAENDAVELALRAGADIVPDPGGGQGAAVEAALGAVDDWPVVVVNADVPRATPADVRALLAAAPALVAAADGTTNALSLPVPGIFRPVYGPGSAARFERLGLRQVDLPNLAADVDTLSDLELVGRRREGLGVATLDALRALVG
jgi:2-phospho-L-lactate guanylyltransferase